LIEEGKTPDEIAKKLKIGIGEVMLVKNLDNN
jgi:DNA-binding CsgD family transcriptional regulator